VPRFLPTILAISALVVARITAGAANFPSFDFHSARDAGEWIAVHDSRPLAATADGLRIGISGPDPYIHGPARDYPAAVPLWMEIRIRSEAGGGAQVFWFGPGPTSEEHSVRFHVPRGQTTSLRVPMPALGPGTRLRFDPPGMRGDCTIGSIAFAPRLMPIAPAWPAPPEFRVHGDDALLAAGRLALRHSRSGPGMFRIEVDGVPMAVGHPRGLVGYTRGGTARWFELAASQDGGFRFHADARGIRTRAGYRDPDGATWSWEQDFRPVRGGGAIAVTTRVTVDADRDVLALPMLALFPGVGSFGTNKTQGLLAGVEYLENEESSSERDLAGPQANRLVPDSLKRTFPLAALSRDGRWLAMEWDSGADWSVLHDSPDRTFGSGGHAWCVQFPGADPAYREDGAALPYEGRRLAAGLTLRLDAVLSGGAGGTVVPAVRGYLSRHGLPAAIATDLSDLEYFRLAAHGWLDSKIREGNRYRHAVGGNFHAGPAADAAVYEAWLSAHVRDPALSARLDAASEAAFGEVRPALRNAAQIGHVRHGLPALVSREAPAAAVAAAETCRGILGRFRPDGTVPFRASGDNARLGSTHWADHANGLTGALLVSAMDNALASGDRALVDRCIDQLRKLDVYRDGVPRGAQTWEVPLHTPDILASAHLARAYTLGYEFTGDPGLLGQAIHWAWTGVPFVYLVAPAQGPVGVYSTIPVLGATQFVAPNWIGLPVQWCGLVYADAIRRVARHDPKGPWIRLADGIAKAGIQQMHRADEPEFQGCLPDSYDLRAQQRNPVPINPATLLPLAIQSYGLPPVYDERVFRRHGLWVTAPGRILEVGDSGETLRFRVEGWPRGKYQILVGGCARPTRIRIGGKDATSDAAHRFETDPGRLFLELETTKDVELGWRPGK